MSDLVALANQKIEAALQKRLQAIPREIEAIKVEHAAKGLAQSGATLKRVRVLCIDHLHGHGDTIAKEYNWALSHALLANQTWAEGLATDVTAQLQPLMTAAEQHLTALAAFTGMPELAQRLINDIDGEFRIAESNTKLTIRIAFAEKKRGLVRSLPSILTNLLSRIIRPGA
jgi:hypothetical protein